MVPGLRLTGTWSSHEHNLTGTWSLSEHYLTGTWSLHEHNLTGTWMVLDPVTCEVSNIYAVSDRYELGLCDAVLGLNS